MRPMPTLEQLQELLDVNASTGAVTWRVARNSRGGVVKPGTPAGWDAGHGYRTVTVMQRDIKLHRLVWLFAHGRWPNGHLDHVNGDRSDNRVANLREASARVNAQNYHGLRRHNTSGVSGVYWDRRRRAWVAQISVDKKHVHLGQFSDKEAAAAAVRAARAKFHPEAYEAYEASMIAALRLPLPGAPS